MITIQEDADGPSTRKVLFGVVIRSEELDGVKPSDLGQVRHHDDVNDEIAAAVQPEVQAHRARGPGEVGAEIRSWHG